MAVSSSTRNGTKARIAFGCALTVLGLACSTGDGEGWATGTVNAPACGLDNEPFDLRPNFFTADPAEDFLEIRVQHGSDRDDLADRLSIFVANVSEVKASMLEVPLEIGMDIDSPVRMSLALNQTCPIDRRNGPVNLVASSGSIVFHSIYSPVGPDEPVTHATFTNVVFTDNWTPSESDAVLSGEFSFVFARGRPAQYFP